MPAMRYAALLRAVNVGGRKVTMKELRESLTAAGYGDVATLQAAGSVVLETSKAPDAKLEAALEKVIETTFGLTSEVMVRNPAEWTAILKANPFPKKANEDPAHLVCVICKEKPDIKLLEAYLAGFRANHDKGEKLKVVGREIYIDYGLSIGESRLILPKKACIGTARNWNTMLKIEELLRR
jgi:uncharacterized protein (DUF1697 family)